MQRYVIQPNDTLYKIAQKFGISMSQLIEHNPHIQKTNKIYPGETIYLPGYQYVVVPGDNFSTIAHLFKMPVSILIAANPQVFNTNHLSFGQRINIPRIPLTASDEKVSNNTDCEILNELKDEND